MPEHAVWVVEDDAELRELVAAILSSARIRVDTFEDGRDVLGAWDAGRRCDLLVTDHHLSRMHGLDVVAWLRARDQMTPVILVTAFADDVLAQRAADLAAVDVVEKPCNVYTLRRRVLDLLG